MTEAKAASRPEQGEAKAADGTRIVYEILKSPNAKGRVALVHSLAMTRDFWRPVAERLSDVAEVLIYDCRGHGESGKPAGPYTVDLFASDLAGLLDHVGWRSAVVAGASMGGSVSIAFAAAYPERVAGLGLVDTTSWYGAEAPQQWAERGQKAASEGLRSMVAFQKTRWFGDAFRQAHPDVVENAVKVFVANDVRAYAETCGMLGACDMRGALPDFDFPVRILVGEEDYATPPTMARAMHEQIPGSALKVIEGARHLTPLEVPDIIAENLKGLLQERHTS